MVSPPFILPSFFPPAPLSLFLSLTQSFHVGSKEMILYCFCPFVVGLWEGTSQAQHTDRDESYVTITDLHFFLSDYDT